MLKEFNEISWGKIRHVSRIGRGGMAELFLVESQTDFGTKKAFVIKKIHEDLYKNPISRSLFIEEARIHSTFSHPNIVQFIDFGYQDDFLYMALEYVEGGDLRQFERSIISDGHRLETGLKALKQIAQALSVVHKVAIHQDISPGNILCAKDDLFKLCDFGVAKKISCVQNKAACLSLGKFRYMSPEQISGRETDARSDIFSLGVTFAGYFSKKRPYAFLPKKDLPDLLRHGGYLREFMTLDLSEPIRDLILRCVQPSPADRFQTAADLANYASAIAAGLSQSRPHMPYQKAGPCYRLSEAEVPQKWAKIVSILVSGPLLIFLPIYRFLTDILTKSTVLDSKSRQSVRNSQTTRPGQGSAT